MEATVVVRASGERTLEPCLAVLEQADYPVTVVEEVPFCKAVERTVEIGLSCSTPYLITVDADLLLFPESLPEMVESARSLPHSFFFFQGSVFDRVRMSYRKGGPHLYHTAHLGVALQIVSGELGDRLRPERFLVDQMELLGYPWFEVGEVYGVHDFCQWNKDLYRKAFAQAVKARPILDLLLPLCRKALLSDPEYSAVLGGLEEGRGQRVLPPRAELERRFEQLGLAEKSPWEWAGREPASLARRLLDEHLEGLPVLPQGGIGTLRSRVRGFSERVNQALKGGPDRDTSG